MPDAYDALSARLIERAGFEAVQCSGYSMSLSAGLPREDELSLERNLAITRDICRGVDIPVMGDGEDGYGPPDTVVVTVSAFIDAGVSGLNLEDQALRQGRRKGVIGVTQMVEKLIAAREAAAATGGADFVINGRTDALATGAERKRGLDAAIERGGRYLEAGADLIFVTDVTTLDEAREIINGIPGPVSIAALLPYNLRTLPLGELKALGPARISLPTAALFSAARGMTDIFASIRDGADLAGLGLDPPF